MMLSVQKKVQSKLRTPSSEVKTYSRWFMKHHYVHHYCELSSPWNVSSSLPHSYLSLLSPFYMCSDAHVNVCTQPLAVLSVPHRNSPAARCTALTPCGWLPLQHIDSKCAAGSEAQVWGHFEDQEFLCKCSSCLFSWCLLVLPVSCCIW